MVIAIDGPAGAGKSTVARGLAGALGATYLDSGAMYRCVALAALRAGVGLGDGVELGRIAGDLAVSFAGGEVLLDGETVTAEIRAPEGSAAASRRGWRSGSSRSPRSRGCWLEGVAARDCRRRLPERRQVDARQPPRRRPRGGRPP